MKILLMGNPNVGKSVIFSRMTGIQVMASNYPGSTVGFKQGRLKLGQDDAALVDVPGTYTLHPTNEAEEVAVKMLAEGDVALCIMDATRLERGLPLTLQLLERKKPMIVVLNMWDEAGHKGIKIDVKKLSELLCVPVLTAVAVTGQGIKEIVERIPQAVIPDCPSLTEPERWQRIGEITAAVQQVTHRHHTMFERFEDFSIHPIGGIVTALVVLAVSFLVIRVVSEGLIGYVIEPLFNYWYRPALMKLSHALGGQGIIHGILIGKLIGGQVDFKQSFGILSTGLFVPLGMVYPYVFAFYLVLGLLEDFGYLPRLAILMDVVMHRLGLHGYAIIPTILGIGCNVPGILATRILESRRERFIACTLISIGVPCAALHAMIFGLVGERGARYVILIYAVLLLVWIALGVIMNRITKGFAPELFTEIPPYRKPVAGVVWKKLMMRMRMFFTEAVPVVLIGVLVVNLLYMVGVFDFLAGIFAPVVTNLLGLPKEAVVAIVIGFLRKDVAVGMLGPLNLTNHQLVVACVVLSMFFPCIATFTVMLRELGWKDMIKSTAIMLVASVAVGTALNWMW